jgi:hypothetical protein
VTQAWSLQRRICAAVLFALAYRLAAAWLIALPFGSALDASGIGQFPEGDALLFARGALYLLEVFVKERALLSQVALTGLWPLFAFAVGGILPLWFMLRAVRPALDNEPWLSRAGRELSSLLLLSGLSWLFKILIVSVALGVTLMLRAWVDELLDERSADLLALLPIGIALLPLAGIAVLRDLARAAVVGRDAHAASASHTALGVFRAHGTALIGAFVFATIVAILALAASHALVVAIGVGPEPWRAQAALVTHQLGLLSALVVQASWLRRAMNAVDDAGAT